MSRLTTKDSIMGRKHDLSKGCASVWKTKLKNYRYELIEEAVDKLGQLEDILEKYNLDTPELLELDLKYSHKFSYEYGQIEEELGVDLITLFKALKDGVYYRFNQKDKLTKMKKPMLRVIDNKLCLIAPKWITTTWMNVKLKDYGKTRALTKEELL